MSVDTLASLRSHLTDGGHNAALTAVHSTDEALAALRRRLRSSSIAAKPKAPRIVPAPGWLSGLQMFGLAAPILAVLLAATV